MRMVFAKITIPLVTASLFKRLRRPLNARFRDPFRDVAPEALDLITQLLNQQRFRLVTRAESLDHLPRRCRVVICSFSRIEIIVCSAKACTNGSDGGVPAVMNSLYCVMMSSRIRCANSEASATFLLSRTCCAHSRSLYAVHRRPGLLDVLARRRQRRRRRGFSMRFHRRRLLSLSAAARSATPNDETGGLEPPRAARRRAPTTPGLNLVVSDTGDRNDSPFDAANVVEISLRRSATRAKLSTVTRPFSSLRTSSNAPRTPGPSRSAPPGASAPRPRSPARRRRSRTRTPRANGRDGDSRRRALVALVQTFERIRPIVGALRRVRASCERGDLARNASMRARNSSISRSRGGSRDDRVARDVEWGDDS